jgi:uncharacterized integral membrane protein (TIGR00698 family)
MNLIKSLPTLWPGLLTAALIAIAAKFLSLHYSMPAMLLALLLGLAMNSVFEGPAQKGVTFASKNLLRFAVGLLGVRVSYGLIAELGVNYLVLTACSIAAIIGFGALCARLVGQDKSLGILTGGATAICGASAAVAIASVLPSSRTNEKRLTATVFAVTALSTLAMIAYPLLTDYLGYTDALAGAFLGATIHDVAQVVGAGLSISEEAGNSAVLVKLFRVSMLAPVVLIISLWVAKSRADEGSSGPLLPSFVVLFFVLAGLNSMGWIPRAVVELISETSSWGLLIAIAAVGMKTSFKGFWSSGSTVFYLVIAETLLLAAIFVGAIHWMGLNG